ncbi:MAG TPA: hypothetical protein VLJ62_23190 [Burkholderiaceae bacterium]|nr:hypothetical protein [Burkholderiaceae bacterium]
MSKKPSAQGGTATKVDSGAAGLAAETPLVLTLRDVEVPLPPTRASTPVDDGLVLSDTELQPEPWLGDPDADREAQRTARRAQVRRDRHREVATDAPKAPEMLVLSTDDTSCAELCAQLREFGFGVQVMAQPPALPAPWSFAAVFVTMPIHTAEGGDTFDLCNQVREASRLPGQKKPLLVLATPQLSSTDRVRAGLAGCHEILLGPVNRGSVAQLLDARGIALPSDARRV